MKFINTMGVVAQSTQQVIVFDLGMAALGLLILGLALKLALDAAAKAARSHTRARALSYLAVPAE